ncbi:hypothetical protein [Nocardia sp. NPDC059228]|uniref:hypothetical protein n=1 Tax=Nocardia sp. NPDC059228 TaxID=3346777 RepID=UPI003694FD0F
MNDNSNPRRHQKGPEPTRRSRIQLAPTLHAGHQLRCFVDEVCNGWLIGQAGLLTRLVATELVEQMLSHAHPGHVLTIELELRGPQLLIRVHTPHTLPATPVPNPIDTPAIMARLTTSLGHTPYPDNRDTGYTLWAGIAVDQPARG